MSTRKRPKFRPSLYKALTRLQQTHPAMDSAEPIRLRCSVQTYDWGKVGEESLAARLFSLNSQSPIDSHKPYAELWIGTHESGPSFVVGALADDKLTDSVSLKSWIDKNPHILGNRVIDKWGSNLPFLFKVLSVAKTLSIQAHPDKELARALHDSQPDVYKDSNHKPEMALALTEFEALCGFVSLQELKSVINTVPEIVELVGGVLADKVLHLSEQDSSGEVKSGLRSFFTRLMSANKDAISEMLSKLRTRLVFESKVRKLTEKEHLALRLENQHPTDVGVLSTFLMNYMKLKPGEALYLDANEPHAYICGDCVECMATSDNVVRAGFTRKDRDVETLCSMLTYKQGLPEILQGIPVDQYTRRYSPPFDEFEVDSCFLPPSASCGFVGMPGPSIYLVVSGEGSTQVGSTFESVKEGDVLFIPSGTEFSMTASIKGMKLYRAGVNSKCFV